MKRFFAVTLATTLVIVCSLLFNVDVKADLEDHSTEICFGLEPALISDSMCEWVKENIVHVTNYIHLNGDCFGYDQFDSENIFVLNPFLIYDLDEEGNFTEETSEIYYFPVYSSGRILFLVQVKEKETGNYVLSETNWMVNDLNNYLHDNANRRIYIAYHGEEMEPVLSIADSQTFHNDNIFMDLKGMVKPYENREQEGSFQNETKSKEVESNGQMRSSYVTTYCPTNGFSVNQPSYKRLNMSYCLVSDTSSLYDSSIPCIATIYRYRTATYVLGCSQLLQENNNHPGGAFNLSYSSGQVGLINYLMPLSSSNLYAVHGTVVTYYDTQRNINNKFPILIGAHQTYNNVSSYFVVEGYYMDSGLMVQFIYNPRVSSSSTEPVTSTSYAFTDGAPATFISMNQEWYQSGNSCMIP